MRAMRYPCEDDVGARQLTARVQKPSFAAPVYRDFTAAAGPCQYRLFRWTFLARMAAMMTA